MTEAQDLPAIVAEVEEPASPERQTPDAPQMQAAELQAAQLAEFDRRIRDLEAAIGDLRTVNAAALKPAASGRKTLSAQAETLLSKHGLAPEVQATCLDAALASLSIEQRIAVKTQMLRAGLLQAGI